MKNFVISLIVLIIGLVAIILFLKSKVLTPLESARKALTEVMFPLEKITDPVFNQYRVAPYAFNKASSLILEKGTDNWNFRTRYRKAFEATANFAGKYKVVQWGCGTQCQQNSLINLATGEIINGFTSSYGVGYKLNSTLFIVNPFVDEDFKHGRSPIYASPKLYNFDGNKFYFIKNQAHEIREFE
jgi:hypothetical protein